MSPAAPHVRIHRDALEIDGERTFLYGGEMQYFRVRDPDFDGPRTERLWAERLDRLAGAGLNTISTYLPWDYHAPGPGAFDFSGARNVRRFCELAAERGFRLIVKPGPHILAEWPYGFGSWGAIPTWWLEANPGELVQERGGRIFRWHPLFPRLARFRNALPSYASHRFLEDVRGWFEAVVEQLGHLVGPGQPVIAWQLDNEPNLFWSDPYRIDHHSAAIERYHDFLEDRYGSTETLSRRYRMPISDFASVEPPRHEADGPMRRQQDWFDHQQQLVADYLSELRVLWEDLGVREPEVLFLTNDTPQAFPGLRDLLLPVGPLKNRPGLHCLDTYPRAMPWPGRVPFDNPWEPDFFCKLYDRWNDVYTGPSRFAMGIEIQGGHFSLPVPLVKAQLSPHTVTAEATRQTLLRLVAHGMKAIVVYTIVGGLNLDGSPYDFQAALKLDGTEHPRLREIERLGQLVAGRQEAMLGNRAVESPLLIAMSSRVLGPGGGHVGPQRIFSEELRGLFGWCAQAGFTARVTDLALAEPEELASARLIIHPSCGRLPEAEADKLREYVVAGGSLLQLLHPEPLSDIFPGAVEPPAHRLGRRARLQLGEVTERLPVRLKGVPGVALPDGAEPLLWLGDRRRILGYRTTWGRGSAALILPSMGRRFAGRRYYSLPHSVSAAACRLLRYLAPAAPLFDLEPHDEIHARRLGGSAWLFLFANHTRGRLRVQPTSLAPLGLEGATRLRIDDLFEHRARARVARMAAQELVGEGLEIDLPPWGSTILEVSPEE